MTDMVFGTVAAKPGDPILPRWWRSVDKVTLLAVILLFLTGLLVGMAASVPLAERNGLNPFYYVYRQAFFGFVALLAMIFLSMASPRMVRRLGVMGFVLGFVALALLPALGTDFGKGAVRWYSLGFTSLQPSEFLKPCFLVFSAWLMAASFEVGGPPGKRLSLMVTIAVAAMLVLQPDFGQASLYLAAWGIMYFVAGAPMMLLLLMTGGVLWSGYFAYHNSEHFARRIDGFLSPDVDPRTQLGYATNAIQEGGYFGVGVGEGTVKWSLPDAHTDFIIAVAAEEYGLFLVLFIILLFMAITVRSFMRLTKERDPFIRFAGTGIVAMFGMQAFINMGVAVRLLPAKGMTLPFISYGGSSLLAGGIALGFLLALTRKRPQGDMADVLGRERHRVPGPKHG